MISSFRTADGTGYASSSTSQSLSIVNNMHDRSAKFNIGFAFTASRLYELEPNSGASAIDFRLRRLGDPARGPRPGCVSNRIMERFLYPKCSGSRWAKLLSARRFNHPLGKFSPALGSPVSSPRYLGRDP